MTNERTWDQWHIWRYQQAAEWVDPDDVVVDAACGFGHGRSLLGAKEWVGVDYQPPASVVADLTEWVPDFRFDVWVGLETIEHLPAVDHYAAQAKKAGRYVVVSTPTTPTAHINEWHVRDFTADEVVELFTDERWNLVEHKTQTDDQDYEYGFFVFGRR